MKKLFFLLTAFAFLRGGLSAQLPDFTQTDCNNVTHHLYADLAANHPVILNFCAGWCGPCRDADPKLEAVYQSYCGANGNLLVYGMLFEDNGHLPSDCVFGQQYASTYGLTFPILTNIGDWNNGLMGQYFTQYGLNAIPQFLVIIPNPSNPSASTVHIFTGNIVTLQQDIENYLTQNGFPTSVPGAITATGTTCGTNASMVLTSPSASGNLWSTGSTSQSITVTASGTYTVTIAGQNCNVTKTITVSLNEPVEGDPITMTGVPCGDNASVVLTSPSASGNLWSTSETTPSITVNSTGFYELVYAPADPANECPFHTSRWVEFAPSPVAGTATISTNEVCESSPYDPNPSIYILHESGGVGYGMWQIYVNNAWVDWIPADVLELYYGGRVSQQNGTLVNTGRFRVVYSTGPECSAISNEVSVNFKHSGGSTIKGGEQPVCRGTNVKLEVDKKVRTYYVRQRGLVNLPNYDGCRWYTLGGVSPGVKWMDAGVGNVTSVTIELNLGMDVNGGSHSSLCNGLTCPIFTQAPLDDPNCANTNIVTLNLPVSTYLRGQLNTFTVGNVSGLYGLKENAEWGGAVARITVRYSGNQFNDIVWSPGGSNHNSINVTPLTTTTYTATLTEANGCVTVLSQTVVVNDPPVVTVVSVPSNNTYTNGDPTTLFLGYGPQSTTLNVTTTGNGPFTYQWTGGGLSCNNCSNPVFTPVNSGSKDFTVVVTDQNGCSTSYTITICVNDIRCGSKANAPKVQVCTTPPANPNKPKTNCVSVASVASMLTSGSVLGPCNKQNQCGYKKMDEAASAVDADITVLSAFPNPFESRTTLNFHVPEDQDVSLKVYDLTGKVVATLFEGQAETGKTYSFSFSPESAASGLYFARMVTSSGEVKSEKLVLQR